MPQTEVQQRATQAISGIATALTDLTAELHNAQQQLQYWRVEADAWKARYEQERARNNRLRRVLRCTPLNPASSSSSSLSMARSLTSTPKALRGSSSVACPAVSTAEADAAELAAMSAQQQQPQEEGLSGGGVTRRRSSTDAKSPLSPQTRQQHHQQPPGAWSNSNAGPGSSSLLSPAQQQQQSHTSFTQQRQQQLRPLKCVPEAESSSSGSGTDLAAQGKAAEAGRSATAATVAPAGSDSPSADPFANYDVGPVSDPGEHPFHQQPQQQRSSEAGCPPANLQQQQQLAGARTGARADADAAPAIPTFRRSRTLPVDGSLSTVHSPSFAAGFGPGSFLHQAASWLPPLGPGQGGDRGQGRHTVDQLLRMMMAFTLMQGAAGDADEQQSYSTDEDVLPSVSLDDDEGSSGVGLAAAAAVSAAMARAWATAASREQKAVAAAASAGGSGQQGARQGQAAGREAGGSSGGGRAGFRLVATVTNKMGKRQASTSALSSYASQDSISGLEGSTADLGAFAREAGREAQPAAAPSPKPPGLPISKHSSSSSLVRTASGSADAADGGSTAPAGSSSPSKQLSRFATASTAAAAAAGEGVAPAPAGSSPVRPPPGSSAANAAAAKSAAAPAAGAAPSSSQATTISLQWLSRPRTVLVMRKLAPSTEAAFLRALDWLRRHQVVIYVEPKVFQELVDAGRVIPLAPSQQQQQQQQQSQGPSSSSSAADAAATAGGSRSLPHSSSGSSLAGMLISTSPAPPQSGLFPVNSWAGPCTAGSNGSSGAKPAAAAAAGAGAGAVVGAGGAGAGVIKTWQPEVQLDPGQQGQQQQGDGSSGSGSGNGSMVQASDLIPDAVAQQLDLVVVLGGDGTVLWTCHIFGNRSVPPLVPFNLGSLGFLTPFDPARLEQVLLKTFRGSFPITLRHRLHCTIVRCSTSCPAPNDAAACDSGNASSGGLPSVSNSCVGHCVYGEEHVSLNEVVIERGISPFLTNLECFCDGTFVTHVQGDGLIVGTPTGSTAYSLAAGGSMVHPQVPCILFTPICPHSLSFRPLMFPDYVQLCVQVPADARGHVWASFDGKDRTELGPGDAVVIRLSKWPVPSVAAEADPSSDWFSAVRECLHWNMRKVQGGAGM